MDKEALEQKTVAELRDMARGLPDVKGISSMKKDDLVQLLAARGAPDEEPGGTAKPSGGTPPPPSTQRPADKATIKERIRALKAQKRDALEQQDRAKSRHCNRQIHRYKRQLRKMARAKRKKD